eukprot:9130775-Lingulodinium_polyedra.AAC.1
MAGHTLGVCRPRVASIPTRVVACLESSGLRARRARSRCQRLAGYLVQGQEAAHLERARARRGDMYTS